MVLFDMPQSYPSLLRSLQAQIQPKGWSQVGTVPRGQSGESWALEVAPAWQGTKGQSVERPQEHWLIEEEELERRLPGPCRRWGWLGAPGILIREQVQLDWSCRGAGIERGKSRGVCPGSGQEHTAAGSGVEDLEE